MNQATLLVRQSAAHSAEISLQGDWLLDADIPSTEIIEQQLQQPNLAILSFVPHISFEWDSRLLAFLKTCQSLCSSYNIQMDISQMPAEVRQLFKLANAVPEHKPTSKTASFLRNIVNGTKAVVDEVIDFMAFTGEVSLAFIRWATGKGSARFADILHFCQQAGPSAIPIITLQSVLVGMILAYLGMVQLSKFGAEVYVSNLVAVGMVREMGALMTAVIMSGRTGAAYAAQLGTMQVNEEIDALATIGINPVDYLVVPRTLGLIITMPLLCLYSNIMGMLGGGLVATGMNVTWRMYLFQLFDAITVMDVMTGLFKGYVFAELIAIAGCRAGLACGRSSAAVGQATTKAVVTAIIYLVVADAILNILYFKLGI